MISVNKFLSLAFLTVGVLSAQQPTWQQIRMGCLHKEFIGRTPVPGTQCNCINCTVGPNDTCVEQAATTSVAIYSQGKWTCSDPTGAVTPVSQWPVYLYAHMQDDDQTKLRLSYSRDARNWNNMNRMGSFEQSSMRDPSVVHNAALNRFFFTSSPSTNPFIPIWSSDDLVTFSAVTQIDIRKWIPGATQIWAPEWYYDETSNKTYIIGAVSIAPDPYALTAQFTCYFFEIDLNTRAVVGTPTAVTINGSIQQRYFDFTIYKSGGVYYMLYVDQSPVGDSSNNIIHQYLAYATSSTLLGAYTQQTPAGTDYFGVTDQVEGVTMVQLDSGCVRITYDEFANQPVGNGTGGRKYSTKFKDTCPPNLFGLASLTPAAGAPGLSHYIASAEHGTIIKLAPATIGATRVLDGAEYYKTDSYTSSRYGVNTEGRSLYTFSVKSRAASPGYIQYNEAAAIGVDSGGGQYAMMAACGNTNNSCAIPFPGEARWSVHASHDGDEGMMQFNNAIHKESSILFGTGIRQFGRRPLTVAKQGDRALWHMGSNKAGFEVPFNGQRFFIYNRGFQTSPGIVGQTVGFLRNNLPSGCYGFRLLVGANPIQVTHLGRWIAPGNIGNHKLYILSANGSIAEQYTLDMTTAGADGSGYYAYVPVTNGALSYYTLSANTAYYIMSTETLNGDSWYDDGTTVQLGSGLGFITNAAAQITCGSGAPQLTGGVNKSFGPLSFMYSPDGNYGGVAFSIENQGSNEGAVEAHYGLIFGSGHGSAYNTTVYGSIDSIGSLPSGVPRINLGTGVIGSSDAAVMMGRMRAGQGAIPTGNMMGWFQNPDNASHTYVGIIANAPDKESRIFLGPYDAANINLNPMIGVNAANKSMVFSTGTGNGSELTLDTNTGAVYAQWGLAFGWGTEAGSGTGPFASIDAYGSRSSGVKRLNLGTGVLGSSDALVLAKAIDVNYIGRRGGANNDLAGFLTLDGTGAGSYTFVNSSPATNATCTCTVNSSLAACQNFKSGNTIQFRGPAGANVSYVCILAEF